MEPAVNPYESPSIDSQRHLKVSTQLVRERVWLGLCIPCFAFIVLGGLQAVALPWMTIVLFRSGEWPDQWGIYRFVLGHWIVLVLTGLMIAAAGVRLLQLRSWRVGVTAAILCSLPYLSPLYFLGIPFGLWAVIVLMLPGVRQVFADESSRTQTWEGA